MKIDWTMSIGYPSAKRTGTIEVTEEEIDGLTEKEVESYIDERVFEDAIQHVDTSWNIAD